MSTPNKSPVMVWVRLCRFTPGVEPSTLVKISVDDLPEGINCYPTFAIADDDNVSPSKSEG